MTKLSSVELSSLCVKIFNVMVLCVFSNKITISRIHDLKIK